MSTRKTVVYSQAEGGALLPLVGLGIYDISLSEGSGCDEIADRHFLLLGGLCDFGGFFLGIIREDGFAYSAMQSTTREARSFAHMKDVSKNNPGRNRLYPRR